jgi:DNA-binding transcriptional ArsR family regulator
MDRSINLLGPMDPAVLAALRRGPLSAAELAKSLGISVPTVHRRLEPVRERGLLQVAGRARRTRYALRRPLREGACAWRVYRIDESGTGHEAGELALLQPQGSWMDLRALGWPEPDEAREGWWQGLPYLLHDVRPQGFMGRAFARLEHEALGVDADPATWSDEDILHVLLQRGWDASGNLILGDGAYRAWQRQRMASGPPLSVDETARAYVALATQAVASGVPGSSAAGEFPKFTARRQAPPGLDSRTPHVLVKFSGADDSTAVRRWSDLLVCEHLALQSLGRSEWARAACSRILQADGRTFLEVERFDRHGEWGRSSLASLESVNAALLGIPLNDWIAVGWRLSAADLMDEADALAIERLTWFGRLLANTDMHAGNLSFTCEGGRLRLAPAYDMLPMLHAPLPGGEVPPRTWESPMPLPGQRESWHAASTAALGFWRDAAEDPRVTSAFRTICADHGRRLEAAARHA